ncbi:hypothetical protein Scep_025590 [Stephania cephalantha]|uniref:Uncharacterized protein n=1 Tax=Stephania cephalantha TaxID=152367 RepID=A0AAP0EII8_9MAGN
MEAERVVGARGRPRVRDAERGTPGARGMPRVREENVSSTWKGSRLQWRWMGEEEDQGGEGGSDPWRETPRREEEGGDCIAIFDWRRCIRAAETEERKCGGVTGARSGGSQQQQRQWYVEAFAWQWYVEEEQRPSRQRRRDLRRRQRREEERRQRPYTQRIRQLSGRRR